jgi:hypothetical protein
MYRWVKIEVTWTYFLLRLKGMTYRLSSKNNDWHKLTTGRAINHPGRIQMHTTSIGKGDNAMLHQ